MAAAKAVAGKKIRRAQAHGGSSPPVRTKRLFYFVVKSAHFRRSTGLLDGRRRQTFHGVSAAGRSSRIEAVAKERAIAYIVHERSITACRYVINESFQAYLLCLAARDIGT